ncbi:MAG: carbohydrate-binding domain-containing protein [Bacteroidales bacterium]|nr:carbohydrate-binding domain-containing protein [Bacteroidales bacterium]
MERCKLLAIFAALLLYSLGGCTPNDIIEQTTASNQDNIDNAADISSQADPGSDEGGSDEGGSGEGGSVTTDETVGFFEDGVKFSSLPNSSCDNENDNIANTVFNRVIKVVYSSSGATLSGTDGYEGKISVSGNDVLVDNTGTTEKIVYKLSGTTTDGFFKVYSDAKNGIWLDGVSITNPAGPAINIQGASTSSETYSKGKRSFVIVSGTNTLVDQKLSDSTTSYSDASTVDSEEDMKGTFFSEGQLVFVGSGKLDVTAQGRQGICSDEYLRFLGAVTTTVNSTAGNAVRGKDNVFINSGTIKITANVKGRKGISTDGDVEITGGSVDINMSGSAAKLSGETDYSGVAGIKADNAFNMSGGTVNITSTATGGKGIRVGDSDQESDKTEIDGLKVSGGTLTVKVSGSNYTTGDVSSKGIMVGWAIKSGHVYSAFSGDAVFSGGVTTVTATSDEAIEAKGCLTVSGGEVYGYSESDDGVNCCSTLTVTSGFLCGHGGGSDGIDSNGNMYIKGGLALGICSASNNAEVALDANTEGGFSLYLQGGVAIGLGGFENGTSSNWSQSAYSTTSVSANTWYALKSGSNVYVFRTPSSSRTPMVISASSPTLYSGVTPSGGTSILNGTAYSGGSYSGGSSVSLSSYSGGGSGGGPGGGGPGSGGRPH